MSAHHWSEKDLFPWGHPRPAAAPVVLTWTTTRPTVEGYYWLRAPNLSARVTQFYHPHARAMLTHGYSWNAKEYGEPMEYAGPIAQPEDPK